MKKSFLLILLSFFLSCAIFKSQNINPFIGTFQVKVLDIDGVDVPGILTISKKSDAYLSNIVYENDNIKKEMEILSSYEIDDKTFLIEAFVDGNQIDFELDFEGDTITGMAAGMFEVEGSRTK